MIKRNTNLEALLIKVFQINFRRLKIVVSDCLHALFVFFVQIAFKVTRIYCVLEIDISNGRYSFDINMYVSRNFGKR